MGIQLEPTRRIHFRRLVAFVLAASTFALIGCGVQVYNFGGAGRGTKFILPPGPAQSRSAVIQSWVAYSLALSTCQLEMGGELPSSNTSFDCERRARKVLIERWQGRLNPSEMDDYLDELASVQTADLLGEYVWVFLRERSWQRPQGLDLERFGKWRRQHLGWHRPKTRIIGYWANP